MTKANLTVSINPAAEADLDAINKVLREQEGYVDGLVVTLAEDIGGNKVRFHRNYPTEATQRQCEMFDRLIERSIRKVLNKN
jgi:hypothetical protein